ncbi:hypothetical protein AB0L34_09105 [Micromonospora sp. NPDC052213]|uniref:hypothetical protein n=1 Tax=Micromonospora sp. NPDC052213 TaxID=3155812 RepID=UPI00342FBC33
MTDTSSPESTPSEGWKKRGSRALGAVRKAGKDVGEWSKKRWKSLHATLQRLELAPAPDPPAPGRVVDELRAEPIMVPARGYVFTFTVQATFTWSSEGLRPELLRWHAQSCMPHARQRLARLAAERSRSFAPHAARELEEELQKRLRTTKPWSYTRNGRELTCQPDAWVQLDDRVKAALLPSAEARLKLEHELDMHLRQARSAELLSRRWITILQRHVDGLTADEAAQGLEDEPARALQEMTAMRKAAARWIEELLGHRLRHDGTRHEEGGSDNTTDRQDPTQNRPGCLVDDPLPAGEGSAVDSAQPGGN